MARRKGFLSFTIGVSVLLSKSSGGDSSWLMVQLSPKNACTSEGIQPLLRKITKLLLLQSSYFWHRHCRYSLHVVGTGDQAEIRSTWDLQAQRWKFSTNLPFVARLMVLAEASGYWSDISIWYRHSNILSFSHWQSTMRWATSTLQEGRGGIYVVLSFISPCDILILCV